MKNNTINIFTFVSNSQFFRFLFSGGVGFFANILFFSLSLYITGKELSSSVFAFIFSSIVSFLMQKFFTFKNVNKKNIKKQSMIFVIVALINLGLNSLLFIFFGKLFIPPHLAQTLSAIVIAIWSFFVYRKVIFR